MLICWLSSISSISVGMYPIVLMQLPKSLQPMKPSLSLSNSLKASLSSEKGKRSERGRGDATWADFEWNPTYRPFPRASAPGPAENHSAR